MGRNLKRRLSPSSVSLHMILRIFIILFYREKLQTTREESAFYLPS